LKPVGELAAGPRGKTSPPVIRQPRLEHSVSLSRFTSNSGGGSAWDGLLDRRYKVSAAHMTDRRFKKPEKNGQRLVSLLAENRRTDFGKTEVNRLQLIWGGWYAARNIVRTLQEYPLSAATDARLVL
jgi:hypothetical protein